MMGDDSTDPAGVSTDDSGMSVVTVVGTPSNTSNFPWLLLLLIGAAVWLGTRED